MPSGVNQDGNFIFMKIGIDIMGGDYAPDSTIGGAIEAAEELKGKCQIALIGDSEIITKKLSEKGGRESDFVILHAQDVISMNEHPTRALPQKPNSSISLGFTSLKKGEIDAFCSAGNTGAMLVGSIYFIGNINGIIRPCITTVLPKTEGGFNLLLDVGAIADCKPDVLYQFAVLGSIYASQVFGVANPKVGLLNIGEEEEKGNLLTQSAYKLMKDSSDFNFIGNVEGRDIFKNQTDVIVCDGFTGNIVLKQAEGFYSLLKERGINDEYFERFNYEYYGGTPVLGVKGNVIIGHGISNERAVKNMLIHSYEVAESKLSHKIKEAFL